MVDIRYCIDTPQTGWFRNSFETIWVDYKSTKNYNRDMDRIRANAYIKLDLSLHKVYPVVYFSLWCCLLE